MHPYTFLYRQLPTFGVSTFSPLGFTARGDWAPGQGRGRGGSGERRGPLRGGRELPPRPEAERSGYPHGGPRPWESSAFEMVTV